MTSTDRSGDVNARHADLMIRGEFSYDADDGSLAWSSVAATGAELEPDALIDLDTPPVRQAIDLSVRDGTPFSIGHSVLDAEGVAHDVVLCGLPDTHQGHTTVRGVVLQVPSGDEATQSREIPRLTNHLGRLPVGVSVTDLPWAGADALPPDLLATVNLCLDAGEPTMLTWGEQRRIVYNQAFADMIPEYHPRMFGASQASVWPEGWTTVSDAVEGAFATGEPVSLTDQLLPLTIRGEVHERYFTFSLTPIRQDDGTVLGLYAPVTETTRAMHRRRRLATLHDLALSGVADVSIPALFARLATTLAANPADIPFALMYLVEPAGGVAMLQGTSGLAEVERAEPDHVRLDDASGWPFAEVVERGGMLMVDDVQLRVPGLRTASGQSPERALLAFSDSGHDRLPGSLTVLGVSTRQALDAEYQQFLHKVARHVHADLTAVAGAQLDRERSANLQRAMQSNRQIGAAIGILMTIHKVTEQQAFQLLSTASQQSNRKLREIADDVVLSGALPAETAQPGPRGQAAGRRGRSARSTR